MRGLPYNPPIPTSHRRLRENCGGAFGRDGYSSSRRRRSRAQPQTPEHRQPPSRIRIPRGHTSPIADPFPTRGGLIGGINRPIYFSFRVPSLESIAGLSAPITVSLPEIQSELGKRDIASSSRLFRIRLALSPVIRTDFHGGGAHRLPGGIGALLPFYAVRAEWCAREFRHFWRRGARNTFSLRDGPPGLV